MISTMILLLFTHNLVGFIIHWYMKHNISGKCILLLPYKNEDGKDVSQDGKGTQDSQCNSFDIKTTVLHLNKCILRQCTTVFNTLQQTKLPELTIMYIFMHW